jgi:AraC-like DNA-binding protein
MVTVCAVVGPQERDRLDAAADGCFTTLHTGSVRQARRVARQRRVDALVVSAHLCRGDELPAVTQFVDEFPTIVTVALVSRHDAAVSETLVRLGANGVRLVVDCTSRAGWHQLRALVAHLASPSVVQILERLRPALVDLSADMRAFLEALARLAPDLTKVGGLARRVHVSSFTLASRFRRARLPSPKAYLAGMRLVHAAHLFANPGLSVAEVAHRLGCSSAQALRRHLQVTLGLTPSAFRRRFPFAVALDGFVASLITPYRETLRTFRPLNAGLWDQGSDVVTRVSREG